MIATFEDEPYRGALQRQRDRALPGRRADLDARTASRRGRGRSRTSRRSAACCPVGCNISATTREGKVKRILSRNHPEVDEGWLCDKGRFAYSAPARGRPIARPARCECGDARLRGGLAGSARSTRPSALLREADGRDRHRALRLRDGRAGLRARQAPAPRASARTPPSSRRGVGCARRLPRAALGDPRCATSWPCWATRRSSSARPIVDLWIRRRAAAAHARARTSSTRRPCASATSGRSSSGAVRAATAARPSRHSRSASARAAPSTCPTPRTAAASATPGRCSDDAESPSPDPIGLLIVSGDEAAAEPGRARARREGRARAS